jgi:hypothetical protein
MNTENTNKHEIPDEYIDIEEYAKAGKEPPKGKKYLIKIDKALYKVEEECLTGREILEIAGVCRQRKWTKFLESVSLV